MYCTVKNTTGIWEQERKVKNTGHRWVFTTFLKCFFCVLYSDEMHSATREGIAYATKSCEISQGLEMKNLSMWQEESAVVPTFYVIFFLLP